MKLTWGVFPLILTICTSVSILCSVTSCLAQQTKSSAGISVETELSTKDVRIEESNLANVILDALKSVRGADAAIMHASAFVTITVPKGNTTLADLLKSVQYKDDPVVIVKLKGSQLKKAFENSLKLLPQKSPEFLQVSGLIVEFNPDGGQEKRVVSIKINGSTVADSASYNIAMPSILAHGALGYYKIWDGTKNIEETSMTVSQAVTDYLNSIKSISGKGGERLVSRK